MTRGASQNPANPFTRLRVEEDPDAVEERRRLEPDWQPVSPQTVIFQDDSQSIISTNDSEDLSFDASLNPYRGCEHGCSYCYARRYHEYLGFSAGLDFETKIVAKIRAPDLLRETLMKPSWRPQNLSLSGVTDAYQPVERRLQITRQCLAVLAEFRQPVVVITKNHLVTRDVDHLVELARWQAVAVLISVTTLQSSLAQKLEPRASMPAMRLRAIQTLAENGVPVGVSIAPLILGLNDHEMPAILEAAKASGASFATYSLVRLPGTVGEVFDQWLASHVSETQRQTILQRIRDTHNGQLNETRAGLRMRGSGSRADQVAQLFSVYARKVGFEKRRHEVTAQHFRRPGLQQLELF